MKWIRRLLAVLAILVLGVGAFALWTALRTDHPVGFQVARARNSDGKPFAIGVWYPTEAFPRPTTLLGTVLMNVAPDAPVSGNDLPLVVISHGNGGSVGSHADLAMALANAGYVVAAPMHTGDNFQDQSAVGSLSWLSERTRQLHITVDHMLKNWQSHDRIDPERIGAYGFSAGAFTVLTAVGSQPDLRLVARHCAESPSEFVCGLLRQLKSPLLNANEQKIENTFLPDSRIKAAVVAAPGFGFAMPEGAFTNVRAPIQLWSAENDSNVPYATNTRVVREGLGSRAEFHSVPGAGHTSFLVPCGLLAPPAICSDPAPFDRKAFHTKMNASVVGFFEKNLSGS